jgi:alpha-beta hydrolase superfamily lysophospholipase
VTLSHGWPLNADAWDGQMLFLAQNGFRCIAHDRRGPGRSSQASEHNDMNGYADDLPALLEARSNRGSARPGSPQRYYMCVFRAKSAADSGMKMPMPGEAAGWQGRV